ncbi:MAG: 50S ribosomal protein L31e [Candidatus Nanohaloarchaea archaeon]
MSRYTVNLTRARSFSRRKRASKAMSILREKLEKQEGEEVSISPEINNRLWENGVENPPGRLEVEVVEGTRAGAR